MLMTGTGKAGDPKKSAERPTDPRKETKNDNPGKGRSKDGDGQTTDPRRANESRDRPKKDSSGETLSRIGNQQTSAPFLRVLGTIRFVLMQYRWRRSSFKVRSKVKRGQTAGREIEEGGK
jgi:hypothetical protein